MASLGGELVATSRARCTRCWRPSVSVSRCRRWSCHQDFGDPRDVLRTDLDDPLNSSAGSRAAAAWARCSRARAAAIRIRRRGGVSLPRQEDHPRRWPAPRPRRWIRWSWLDDRILTHVPRIFGPVEQAVRRAITTCALAQRALCPAKRSRYRHLRARDPSNRGPAASADLVFALA